MIVKLNLKKPARWRVVNFEHTTPIVNVKFTQKRQDCKYHVAKLREITQTLRASYSF